jgi:hypothetical protein
LLLIFVPFSSGGKLRLIFQSPKSREDLVIISHDEILASPRWEMTGNYLAPGDGILHHRYLEIKAFRTLLLGHRSSPG